jgi:hypothetical protein
MRILSEVGKVYEAKVLKKELTNPVKFEVRASLACELLGIAFIV